MNVAHRAEWISSFERLLILIAAAPIAALSLGVLLIPDMFAHLVGAAGTDLYVYRLVGAAALGYAAALAWAARDKRWARLRLLVASLLGFSACAALGSVLQLLIGDTKGIVYLILVLGLAISALMASLLFVHRSAPRPASDINSWLVGFFAAATLLALPFALAPLFLPATFGQIFGLQATDLLLYRLGGAELAGYVVLGLLEIASRSSVEIHAAAIMVLFFNAVAVLASLLALFTGERSLLAYVIVAASGAIALVTLVELTRRTAGHPFGDKEYPTSQSAG
jgi:hypothetical protein